MSKRITAQRTAHNAKFFTEDGKYLKLNAGQFDAIAMVTDGELTVGKIHKFYLTGLRKVFKSGASLTFSDIPPSFGAFVKKDDLDNNFEILDLQGASPALLVTATGEEVKVFADYKIAGRTDVATGATLVTIGNSEIISVPVEEDGTDRHPFIEIYRNQIRPEGLDLDNSGFTLEATVSVASE